MFSEMNQSAAGKEYLMRPPVYRFALHPTERAVLELAESTRGDAV